MSKKSKKKLKSRILAEQNKALKTKRRFKDYTLSQNRFIRRKSAKSIRARSSETKPYLQQVNDRKTIIKVPENISVTADIEALLFFVYQNKKIIETGRYNQLIFDFSKVKTIDDGAMTILLSMFIDMSYKKIKIGLNNLPKNDRAKNFIEHSGFIKYFTGPLARFNNEGLNTTIKKGKATILQKDSASLIRKSMQTVFGVERRNQKLQGMLIELMTNSVNHAYLNNETEKTWYISTNHYTDENKVEFCFVDNGDGIINTINVKLKEKLFATNEDILQRAFNGEFRSRTRLANRGRGLIVVKNNHKNMTIKGLKVITNNVFLDFDSSTAIKLKTPFSGTFYSWIIDKSCK